MENREPREPRVDVPPSHPDCLKCNLWAAFEKMIRTRDEETFFATRREILGY